MKSVQLKMPSLNESEATLILRARLLISRAAGADGLQWWDDRSYTAEAGYIAERIFPQQPRLALAKIALAAANARHWDAIGKDANVVHLFDLGEEMEHELEAVPLEEAWIPAEPITSMDQLALVLGNLLPDGVGNQSKLPTETGVLEVELSLELDYNLNPTILEAGALALAYLTARPNQPVFPCLRRKTRTP